MIQYSLSKDSKVGSYCLQQSDRLRLSSLNRRSSDQGRAPLQHEDLGGARSITSKGSSGFRGWFMHAVLAFSIPVLVEIAKISRSGYYLTHPCRGILSIWIQNTY